MARAKCKYCGKWLDTKESIKITDDGKNRYYCNAWCCTKHSEELIEKAKINAEYDEIIDITREIFGYEFTGYSLLKREINTWEKVGTRAKIIAYLTENKDWLSTVMRKEFASDFNRVRYYSTIVAGKLYDWKPKELAKVSENVVTAMSFEFFEPTVEKQSEFEEQVLYDVEDDLL